LNFEFCISVRGFAKTWLIVLLLVATVGFFIWSLMLALSVATPQPPRPNAPLSPGSPQYVGSQGESPGQFQQPRGITSFPDGSFVVVDRAARVQHFSSDGKPLGLWSMKDHKLGNPKGLCALPDGNLLVCDTHYGRVLVMSVDGKIVKQWGGLGKGPSEFVHPMSAACDAARGFVYVVEYGDQNDRVQKFKLDGTHIKSFGTFGTQPGQFQRPSGIAIDADGNLYIADAANHRIQKFDHEGQLLHVFGQMGREPGQLRYPYDIACSPDGLLYVAEFNNHRVSVFERSGAFVRIIGGRGGPGVTDITGEEDEVPMTASSTLPDIQFANPWSLAVDAKGRLLVSDTGNHRVQIFALPNSIAPAPLQNAQINEVVPDRK